MPGLQGGVDDAAQDLGENGPGQDPRGLPGRQVAIVPARQLETERPWSYPPSRREEQDHGDGQPRLGEDVDELGRVVGPAAVRERVVVMAGEKHAGPDDAGQEEPGEDQQHLGVGAAGRDGRQRR